MRLLRRLTRRRPQIPPVIAAQVAALQSAEVARRPESVPMLQTPAWRWFLPTWARRAVASAVLMLNVGALGLAMSMMVLGAPRAAELGGGARLGFYTGSFTKQTATGNQDINLPVNLLNAPAGSWAIMFWTPGAIAATDTWVDNVQNIVGFVTGTGNVGSAGTWQQDALTNNTSKSTRRMAAKAITGPNNAATPAVIYEADFSGFPAAGQMRLNWTTNQNYNPEICFAIFTGLTGAKIVTWSAPASTTPQAQGVTTVGFRPDLVFHTTAIVNGTLPASGAHAYFGLGMMNRHGQQGSIGTYAQDAVSPSNSSRHERADACIAIADTSDTVLYRAQFQSMDSDGFTTYFATSNTTSAYKFTSLCLKGLSSKIGPLIRNTVTGLQTITSRHDFVPRGLMMMSYGAAPLEAPTPHGLVEIGAYDGTRVRSSAMVDVDNVNPSNSAAVWSSTKLFGRGSVSGGATSYAYAGTFSSWARRTFTFNQTATDSNPGEHIFLLVGDPGTITYPAMLQGSNFQTGATTDAFGTNYVNQKSATTLSTGRHVVVEMDASGTSAQFFYFDADPTQATHMNGEDITGWNNGSICAYVDVGGIERLVVTWKQSGTGGGRTDGNLYVRIGTFNVARSTLTWTTADYDITTSPGSARNYPDVVAAAEGTGGVAHVVMSVTDGSTILYTTYEKVVISQFAEPSGSVLNTVLGGNYATTSHSMPSIVMDPATKRLHAVWAAGGTGSGKGIRYRTASYSAGTWTWASEVEVDNTRYVDGPIGRWVMCRWDAANSKIIVGFWGTNGSNSALRLYESTNFTSFGSALVDHTSGDRFGGGGFSVDSTTGDVIVIGKRLSPAPYELIYRRYRRSNTTFEAAVTLDANSGNTYGGPYSWVANGVLHWVYIRGYATPYAVMCDRAPLSVLA